MLSTAALRKVRVYQTLRAVRLVLGASELMLGWLLLGASERVERACPSGEVSGQAGRWLALMFLALACSNLFVAGFWWRAQKSQ